MPQFSKVLHFRFEAAGDVGKALDNRLLVDRSGQELHASVAAPLGAVTMSTGTGFPGGAKKPPLWAASLLGSGLLGNVCFFRDLAQCRLAWV